jgi:hypothetical protein
VSRSRPIVAPRPDRVPGDASRNPARRRRRAVRGLGPPTGVVQCARPRPVAPAARRRLPRTRCATRDCSAPPAKHARSSGAGARHRRRHAPRCLPRYSAPRPAACPPVTVADLLRRMFAQDVLVCRCGGRRSVVAFVADAGQAHSLLVTLGLPADPATFAPAGDPPRLSSPGRSPRSTRRSPAGADAARTATVVGRLELPPPPERGPIIARGLRRSGREPARRHLQAQPRALPRRGARAGGHGAQVRRRVGPRRSTAGSTQVPLVCPRRNAGHLARLLDEGFAGRFRA